MTAASGSAGGGSTMMAAAAGSKAASGAAGGSAMSAGAAGSMAGAAGSGSASGGTLGGPLKYTDMFTMGKTIPKHYKCPMDKIGSGMGDNKSPALSWTGGPAETKSFAIVLFDTQYMMLHWAMWDIPANVNSLPEGLPSGYELMNPPGAHQAANMGDDKHAYFGPCSSPGGFPAAGVYEFRLYALKTDKLSLMESTTATAAQTAIEGASLEKVVWTGMPE
jgi:Raf kinase inhibitor-like YbhB/YbcL family protein